LAEGLFYDRRHTSKGDPKAGFVLDAPPFDRATILICGDNFGCGSSREHAPWALLDFGIRAIISTSFADIFSTNSANNGLLLATVPADCLLVLLAQASTGRPMAIDIEAKLLTTGTGALFPLEIEPALRQRLLSGRDAIGELIENSSEIDAIEDRLERIMPWLPSRG
jgi:3-isopropylmalate dehydratase small subunit